MNKILDKIKTSDKILLLTHENPDGDAIGSVMGLYHALKDMKKDVTCVVPEFPETFLFLDEIDEIKKESNESYDLAIVLDCSSLVRIGQTNNEVDKCKEIIVIDHHISNTKFGSINYVDENASSCCQVLYYLFKDWKITMTNEIGEALVTGLLTDTAGFRNNNIDKNSFLMAAELMEFGIDIHKVYYLVLSKKTMAQYRLMKMALDRLEMYDDGKIAYSYVSEEDMLNVGAKMGDHEGLVDIGRNIGGVEVSIFIRESEGIYRISLRSNGKVNVNEIAKRHDGGGHKMAAGIKMSGNYSEIKELMIAEATKEIEK